MLISSEVLANSIRDDCGGGGPVVVHDGDPDDLNPAANQVLVAVTCTNIATHDGGTWSANVFIHGRVDYNTREAWLRVEPGSSWAKSGGNGDVSGVGASFDFSHEFNVLAGGSLVDVRIDQGTFNNPVSTPSHGDIDLEIDAILRVGGLPGSLTTVTSYNDGVISTDAIPQPLTHQLLNDSHSSPSLQVVEMDFVFETVGDGIYLSPIFFHRWEFYADGQ